MGREDQTAPWGVGGLSVSYGGTLALSGVDLDVLPGAVTAVIGGDGAGKTSLLRALSGVVAPSAGWVRRPAKEAVGYVAGDRGVYRDLTVDENLAFFAAAYGVEAAALEQRAGALLERSGLAGTGDRLAGDLSGGMRQKLALLAALVHEPELLVLDEPTTGVDPVSRADLWRLMAGAAARGVGVVFATTYLDEAERAAFVLVLHEGRPLAAGSPDELIAAIDSPIVACASRPAPPALAWRRGREWHVCRTGTRPRRRLRRRTRPRGRGRRQSACARGTAARQTPGQTAECPAAVAGARTRPRGAREPPFRRPAGSRSSST